MNRIRLLVCSLVFGFAAPCYGRAIDVEYELSASQLQDVISSFPGVQMVTVERRIAVYADYFSTNVNYGAGEYPEGASSATLGYFAYVPFDGGRPLYSCLAKVGKKRERFSSLDEQCEGQLRSPTRRITGYISSAQRDGTVPLYRCLTDWNGRIDHFDTLDAGCDGYSGTVNEGLLGYIWPSDIP